MTCEEKLQDLQLSMTELTTALEQIIEKPLMTGVIVAGPEQGENDKHWFRVSMGNSDVLLSVHPAQASELGFQIEDLKEGVEVAVVKDGGIYTIVGDQLKRVNRLPQMDLVRWEDIGGMNGQLSRIRNALEAPLTHEKLLKAYSMNPLKGVLLYGPPGCGKTLIAKAAASFLMDRQQMQEDSFIYVKGPELLSMWVGATEQGIRNLFKRTRDHHKKHGFRSVVFIDEADAIMPARGSRRSSDVDKTIVPMFLSEMDGFEQGNPFLILASNLPTSLDPAVIREGRIDLHIEVPRPTQEGTEEIFGIHLSRTKVKDDIASLAKVGAERVFVEPMLSHYVSGAMVEAIVKGAQQEAIARDIAASAKRPSGIQEQDLLTSIQALNHNRKGLHAYTA